MTEALIIEKALGMRFSEYQEDLEAGSMRAFCALAWQIWHRDGRDTDLGKILDGEVEFDVMELLYSVQAAVAEKEKAAAEAEAAQPDPTPRAAAPRTATAGTPTTGTSTSARSRTTSASGRGRSRSS